MKIRIPAMLVVVFLVVPGFLSGGSQLSAPLAQKYKTWLEDEVNYIITTKERDVFLKLETDEYRDRFIEEFWRQRDPTPGTPRNELKDEHYRRLDFADKTFNKGVPFKGRKTERGRIYIALGPPVDVERIITPDAYPMELWYYHGTPALGQTPFFRLLFFQPNAMGDYKLYNPAGNSPKDLVSLSDRKTYLENPLHDYWNKVLFPHDWDYNDIQAYKIIHDYISIELSQAVVSIIPGGSDFELRLPNSVLLAEVQKYPQKKVNDAYAYDFLEHKPSVEVSYSVRFMGNRSAVSVLRDPSGIYFLNYALVPDNLSLDAYQDKYFTDIKTTLRIADPQGKTVFQQEKLIPIELHSEELKAVEKSSFQLYDAVPLIPGSYTFSLLFENTVTKEFTTVDKAVFIPDGETLWMSPLLLARDINMEASLGGTSRAYQVGRLQIYPSLNNTFQAKDRFFVFFQVTGLTPQLKDDGILEFAIAQDDRVLQSSRRNIREVENGRDVLEQFSLEKLVPGTYTLQASLLQKTGTVVFSQRTNFLVSNKAAPGPWVVAEANPPTYDPYFSYVLGSQHLNTGNISQAVLELAKAHDMKPDELDYAIGYAKVLVTTKDPVKARNVLLPFATKEVANYDLYSCLGRAAQDAGEVKDAIPWYQKALSHKGNVVEVLNSLGECYLAIGDKEEALRAWKKSLEVNPNQDAIKKLIEKLTGKSDCP